MAPDDEFNGFVDAADPGCAPRKARRSAVAPTELTGQPRRTDGLRRESHARPCPSLLREIRGQIAAAWHPTMTATSVLDCADPRMRRVLPVFGRIHVHPDIVTGLPRPSRSAVPTDDNEKAPMVRPTAPMATAGQRAYRMAWLQTISATSMRSKASRNDPNKPDRGDVLSALRWKRRELYVAILPGIDVPQTELSLPNHPVGTGDFGRHRHRRHQKAGRYRKESRARTGFAGVPSGRDGGCVRRAVEQRVVATAEGRRAVLNAFARDGTDCGVRGNGLLTARRGRPPHRGNLSYAPVPMDGPGATQSSFRRHRGGEDRCGYRRNLVAPTVHRWDVFR